jgi:flagellar biosynthesis/type III secretory pathway M-ring protein FliF/YscJ
MQKLDKNSETLQTIILGLQQIYDLVGALNPAALGVVTGVTPPKVKEEAPEEEAADEEAADEGEEEEEAEAEEEVPDEGNNSYNENENIQEGGARHRHTAIRRRVSRVARKRTAPSRYTYKRRA